MKAVCMGAKDCKAPNCSTIQGEQGTITLAQPAGQLRSYEINPIHGKKELVCTDETIHRLFYEFTELTRIIDWHDHKTAGTLLKASGDAIWMLDHARDTLHHPMQPTLEK